MAHLTISDVRKSYDGKQVLHGIDIEIDNGQFVVIVGPSGCGKSTLLNILAGFENNSEGSALIDGSTIGRPGPDRGVVFQEAALFPWLTVWENVVFGPKMQGVARADYEERARELLEIVGLQDFAKAYPSQLSGGMRQRVGIARVLVMRPRALLMDEPFGALDEMTRNKLNDDVLKLWQKNGWTIVFVTHSVYEAVYLSSRVVVMAARPGRIVDDIRIDQPFPRNADFRVSTEFAGYCRQVSQALERASAMGQPQEIKA